MIKLKGIKYAECRGRVERIMRVMRQIIGIGNERKRGTVGVSYLWNTGRELWVGKENGADGKRAVEKGGFLVNL